MFVPSTPTLKRKSSLKKIIISSASQEIIRFLHLPNPAANQDPRIRIHILSSKSKHRSLSKTDLCQPRPLNQSRKTAAALNRDCFIRKKNPQNNWKKSNIQFRSDKLKIKNSDERIVNSLCNSRSDQSTLEYKRLNFTFGIENYQNCIKV